MVLTGWLLCAALFTAGGLCVLGISGKYNLKKQPVSYAEERTVTVQAVSALSGQKAFLPEEWNSLEEISYRYNEDIITLLFMGITQEERADALFLLVLNPHEEAMKLIPISSATMAAVDVYDGDGVYEGAITAQIGLQYGFGSSKRESCEYQVNAVRNLFYGIPVGGYLAADMEDIPKVMELIEEFDLENIRNLTDGAELSAGDRLERQSRIFAELISQGKQLIRKDFTIPIKIYNKISGSAVTDMTADEAAYLASTAGGYHFDAGQIVMMPGKIINDGFYPDEDELFELIIDIFYEPAD